MLFKSKEKKVTFSGYYEYYQIHLTPVVDVDWVLSKEYGLYLNLSIAWIKWRISICYNEKMLLKIMTDENTEKH